MQFNESLGKKPLHPRSALSLLQSYSFSYKSYCQTPYKEPCPSFSSAYETTATVRPNITSPLMENSIDVHEDPIIPSLLFYLKGLASESFNKKRDYICKVALSLYEYGCPSYRLESNLLMVSESFRIQGSFVILPSLIIISLNDFESEQSCTQILKASTGFDMYKLQLVENSLNELLLGKNLGAKLGDFIKDIDEITSQRSYYSYFAKILAFGLFSGSVAGLLFRGSWLDMLVSTFM
ncbi:hypothetical protein ROZALSC1DRAFT_30293, partial [Rozella allomycis CSF55]